MSDPHHLNPGSVDAINQGCTCPGLDNDWGRGSYQHGPGTFFLDPDCPLHWRDEFRDKPRETS